MRGKKPPIGYEQNAKAFLKARFWLFFPFIALMVLSLGYYLLWTFIAQNIQKDITAAGLGYTHVAQGGFPSRIGFIFSAPKYEDNNIAWRSTSLQIDLMPYNQEKAVVRLDGPHEFQLKNGYLKIVHGGNIASARADLNGLSRLDMVIKAPVFSGRMGLVNINAATKDSELHILRGEHATDLAKVSITNTDLRLGTKTTLTSADLLLNIPNAWLEDATRWTRDLNNGNKIDIVDAKFIHNALTFNLSGRLGADPNKALNGQLDLRINSLDEFIGLLSVLNVIDRRHTKSLQMLGTFGKFLGDRASQSSAIKMTLEFKRGTVFLEGIAIGAAPKLPI